MESNNASVTKQISGMFSGLSNYSLWAKASEWIFYLVIFFAPLWTLKFTIFPIELNKSYLAYFLIIIAGILFLISILKDGWLKISKNWLFPSVAGIVLASLLSALFSVSRASSFLGLGQEATALSSILFFAVSLVLTSLILGNDDKSLKAFLALFLSFAVIAAYQIFQTFFNISFLNWIGRDKTANLLGSWNELGIFSSLIMLLSLTFFNYLPKSGFKIFSGIIFAVSLVLTVVVNYGPTWWVLAAFLIVFLAYLYSRSRDTRSVFRLPFGALIIVIFFILAAPLVAKIATSSGIQFIEVRPSWAATGDVIAGSLKHNFLLGTGPNTFLYDWFLYRSSDITATPFWQVRFVTGVGYIPTLIAETGALGALALLALFIFFFWYGFKVLVLSESQTSFLAAASFLGAAYLWVFAFIYPLGFFSIFLASVLSGMFVGLASSAGVLPVKNISIFERSTTSFITALATIFMIVLGVAWFYVLGENYYGAIIYAKGAEALSRGNYDRAEKHLNDAVAIRPEDRYYRTLTDLGLIRLSLAVNRTGLTRDELRAEFQATLSSVIQNAQQAIALNPTDPANWINIGRVYEAVVPLQVQGSADFAKNSYEEAFKRFPTNPEPYLAEARVELASANPSLKLTKEFLVKSIALKKDYAPAHFLLAQTEVNLGNLTKAITSAENTVILAPNDIGALFQLGLLYYQAGRYSESQAVFEAAVKLNKNYSNARYFLGLLYARAKDNEKALSEFKKILELNPGNAEIEKIISNISSGKNALNGISPPEPSPEKRKTPPLPEISPKKTSPAE